MINFKANLNSIGIVKRLNKDNSYSDLPVSFVELDINSKRDLFAMKKVANNWMGNIYANDVYERFKVNQERNLENQEERFFALTSQKENFDKLDYKRILGVAEIYLPLGEDAEIEFLQTNQSFLTECPSIKHIGKVIVDKIKNILANETIALYSTYDAIPFYQKQGFKIIEENLMKLVR